MDTLLRSNIRKSLKLISDEDKQYEATIEDLRTDKLTYNNALFMRSVSIIEPVPNFYLCNGKYQSLQQEFFGFYAIKNIIRGCLLSLCFIESGDLLDSRGHLALSTFSYYTAVFHLLYSFLAQYGRVYIDTICGLPKIEYRDNSTVYTYNKLDNKTELLIAKLTCKNSWIFENRSRSHVTRWQELGDLFINSIGIDQVPTYFLTFFRYLVEERYENIIDLIQKGVAKAAKVRHQAIYQGFGFDEGLYYALMNKDAYNSEDLNKRSRVFGTFAKSLLGECLDNAISALNDLDKMNYHKYKYILMASIYMPPFEFNANPNLSKDIIDKVKTIDTLLS